MTRLLVQFYSENPFGGELQELGKFKTPDEAVKIGISLLDNTVEFMFVNYGSQWVRIR